MKKWLVFLLFSILVGIDPHRLCFKSGYGAGSDADKHAHPAAINVHSNPHAHLDWSSPP